MMNTYFHNLFLYMFSELLLINFHPLRHHTVINHNKLYAFVLSSPTRLQFSHRTEK